MRKRIGDILIEEGLLQPHQLEKALEVQSAKGGRLGEILIGQGLISEDSFQEFLARHFGLEYFSPEQLRELQLDDTLLESVPYDTALRFLVLPYYKDGNTLHVVSLAPLSKRDEQMFRRLTHTLEVRYNLGTRPGLNQSIRLHYGRYIKNQSKAAHPSSVGDSNASQEMFLLRREGHCTQCGFPCSTNDRNCSQCGTLLRATDDPFEGQIVGAKWRLGKLIGEGGMGMVYEGTHIDTHQSCAIKLLRAQIKRDDAVIKRFYREVQILRKLKHPGIIEVYEFDHKDELGFYLVMELLQGCTFAEYIEKMGLELPYSEIYLIISQICSAMEHAHQQGVVHRDLKPENIFLLGGPNNLGKVKMLDFGIAKLHEHEQNRLTQTGMTLGTPHYLSPEQAVAQHVDHRSDIYSLTVLLFELLTGQMLFAAESPFQYLMRHVYSEPRTLSQARPDRSYPASLEQLVAEGLAKKPEQRPESMTAYKERLQTAISEILNYDPDEHVKTIAPHMYEGEYQFSNQRTVRALEKTGDVDPLARTQPDGQVENPFLNEDPSALPSYIMTADEWDDDEDSHDPPMGPSTPTPAQAMSRQSQRAQIRQPSRGQHSDNLATPKNPPGAKAGKVIRGAVWEHAHKRDRSKRLFLWFTGLLFLVVAGTAAGTFPSWKHQIFPNENELRQAKEAWKLLGKHPKGFWAKKQTKKKRRRRRRRRKKRRKRRK